MFKVKEPLYNYYTGFPNSRWNIYKNPKQDPYWQNKNKMDTMAAENVAKPNVLIVMEKIMLTEI